MPNKTEQEKALQIVKWVQDNIKLAQIDFNTYTARFNTRTTNDVLSQKTVSYLASCLELTAATIHLLRNKGLDPVMIAHEIENKHTKKPTLHFALEVVLDGKLNTIEFKTGKNVSIYAGAYSPSKSMPKSKSLAVTRFPANQCDPKRPIINIFGVNSHHEFGQTFKHVTGQ